MSQFTINATINSFGGKIYKLTHKAATLNAEIDLNIFLPPQVFPSSSSAAATKKVPALIYLSGLTCTPQNCTEKGFVHAWASQYGLAVIYPDTSPRKVDIPGQDDSWDFGSSAAFYINATKEPWKAHYQMEAYLTKELPELIFQKDEFFSGLIDGSKVSITGHSMGGHGALTLYLKNPQAYKSVSAFAPICNPINCPWGQKAFGGYFESESEWAANDATELIKKATSAPSDILIDVGTGDSFYQQKQLLPENLVEASKGTPYDGKVNVRYQDGYDHSYFFISTFAKDHVEHAAKYLGLL